MNWSKFNTYNESPNTAFETMCNQLFENWCKREYKKEVKEFIINNGSGGDGGVESYAVLNDGVIIGLQAKWFPGNIQSSQISQIKDSFKTAIKLRENIKRYIVCIPRNLGNITGRGEQSELTRWTSFIHEMKSMYSSADIELWNETRILSELQMSDNIGIYSFWFEKSEITSECINTSYERSKKSWLSGKYAPDLDVKGMIFDTIQNYVGDIRTRNNMIEKLKKALEYIDNIASYIIKIESDFEFNEKEKELLNQILNKVSDIKCEYSILCNLLLNDSLQEKLNMEKLNIQDLHYLTEKFVREVTVFKLSFTLRRLKQMISDFISLDVEQDIKKIIFYLYEKRSILFIGGPGTGKTHGIAAAIEVLLSNGFHIPILIQARNVDVSWKWKDIIVSALGLSNSWSDDEIWNALLSAAYRIRIKTCSNILMPKVLIAVDGIDESIPYEVWHNRIKEANVISERYNNIRFIFTSRPNAFQSESDYVRIFNTSSLGDTSVYKLFDKYIEYYNITIDNNLFVKNAITNPLSLKIFCELNQNSVYKYTSPVHLTIASLIREKIKKIENELENKTQISASNQVVFKAIKCISFMFSQAKYIDRDSLWSELIENVNVLDKKNIDVLITYLEEYGLLYKIRMQGEGFFAEDKYLYFPGIQGYFDYVIAFTILDKYSNPQKIDFNNHSELTSESMYMLAIVAIQKFSFLITDNETLNQVVNNQFFIRKLFLFSIRYINDYSKLELYIQKLTCLMYENAEFFTEVINEVILPLSHDVNNPFGVELLDSFLQNFDKPAKRDMYLSMPTELYDTLENRWYKSVNINIFSEEYKLTFKDEYNGRPVIYAWLLASVDNIVRKNCRIALLEWGIIRPEELYKLFLKFNTVNDPQIRADIYSILMSVIFEINDDDMLKKTAEWLLNNIFTNEGLEKNRDAAVRYYSRSIVLKAYYNKLLSYELIETADINPHVSEMYNINMNKDALNGTRMGGYSGIDYDLARYVLIDSLTHGFNDFRRDEKNQISVFLSKFSEVNCEYSDINIEQFILSASYAFILDCGWNEEEFLYIEKNGEIYNGIDSAIHSHFSPATHGSQSKVMSVCEKYVWQSRNFLLGYFSDNLLYRDDSGLGKLNDYSIFDDFIIPSFERDNSFSVNKDVQENDIPELNKIIFDDNFTTFEKMKESAERVEKLEWIKWINAENSDNISKTESISSLLLYGFWCFSDGSDVDTFISIDTAIVPDAVFSSFKELVLNKDDAVKSLFSDMDYLDGYTDTSCYLTPQEICWSPWKKYSNGYAWENFKIAGIVSTVEKCTKYTIENGDNVFHMPSQPMREYLDIDRTDNYLFYNIKNEVVATWTELGDYDGIHSSTLRCNSNIVKYLNREKKAQLVWFLKRHQRESGLSRERFNNAMDITEFFIGFYENDIIRIVPINSMSE